MQTLDAEAEPVLSLEELAGATELVHDPDSWAEDDEEDGESQADVRSSVCLDQIPVDVDSGDVVKLGDAVGKIGFHRETEALAESETRAVEDCISDPAKEENEEQEQSSHFASQRQMPFDQLPHLSPELMHPKKVFKDTKIKEKLAELVPPPAMIFDVHPLLEFARTHFNLSAPRASPFHKPVEFDLTTRLEWDKKMISTPLTRLPKEQAAIACLERFISVHIGAGGDSEVSSEVSSYALEALASLRNCATKGERKEIPSAAELRALQRHSLNDISVMLADGSTLVMQVSAWTASRDLAGLVARKLGVCHEKAFALFEMNDEGEEHLVPDNERVMDLYAEWERTHIDVSDLKQKKKKKKKSDNLASPEPDEASLMQGYHLMYKAYLWVHVDDETAADVGLYYLQAVQNVLCGKYVCDLDVAVELAGYQLYCKLGNDTPEQSYLTYVKPWINYAVEIVASRNRASCLLTCLCLATTFTFTRNQIHEYIPAPLLSATNRAAVAELVLASYNSFVNSWCVQSTQQARLAYLRLCKRQPFYGMTLFHVRSSRQLAVLPGRVIVAVNDMGISILGADSDEVLALFPYADIASWGYSANSFVFNVVRGSEETEYSFKTVQCYFLDQDQLYKRSKAVPDQQVTFA
ncbi:unnamed protein product [Phytophthora lilii]|uniref:Unnamed protein product n=1 Tax=Phytophthora lilii TaxID=2077276 RepID=A0A9W6YGY8_9STRA|nr:unnamed protein product [Phytophthora lilii]